MTTPQTIQLIFPLAANGFKLSPTYDNRLYFYPDENFDMDMQEIPAAKWNIKKVVDDGPNKVVILEQDKPHERPRIIKPKKNTIMKHFTLILMAAALFSCSKRSGTVAPPSPTQIQFTVTDENNAAAGGAAIKLYRTLSDYTSSTNAIGPFFTGSNGMVTIGSTVALESIPYYVDIRLGCKNNYYLDNKLTQAPLAGSINPCNAKIQSTGTIRLVNNSANPYRIYINGVIWINSMPGGTVNLPDMQARPYSIRVLQLSGYVITPTDQTYTGVLTCGSVLTTTFP